MSTPLEMFVDFDRFDTSNIGSNHTLIFSSENTCILQSLKIVNLVNNPIKVTAYIVRDIGGGSTETSTYIPGITIPALGTIDVLEKSIENVKSIDTIYAYSDYSANKFNSFISYQALIQTGGT